MAWLGGRTRGDYPRLLLDSGSQRLFISKRLAEKIGAKVLRKEKLLIGSFGRDEKIKVMEVVQVAVAPERQGDAIYIEAVKVDVISRNSPPSPSKELCQKM